MFKTKGNIHQWDKGSEILNENMSIKMKLLYNFACVCLDIDFLLKKKTNIY